MDLGGFNWTLLTIIGPLILLVVIAYALMRNKVSKRTEEESEAATHRLYQEEERDHRGDE
jgi:hypothetical protein